VEPTWNHSVQVIDTKGPNCTTSDAASVGRHRAVLGPRLCDKASLDRFRTRRVCRASMFWRRSLPVFMASLPVSARPRALALLPKLTRSVAIMAHCSKASEARRRWSGGVSHGAREHLASLLHHRVGVGIQRSIRRSQAWSRAGIVRNVMRGPASPSRPSSGVDFGVSSPAGGARRRPATLARVPY
jgi:hypothetical protein